MRPSVRACLSGGEARRARLIPGMDDYTLAMCALASARNSLSAAAGELAVASLLATSRLANDAAILSRAIDAEPRYSNRDPSRWTVPPTSIPSGISEKNQA